MAVPALKPLIVSAPFGNYIQPAGATPTLGTFTAERRPGRWRRAIGTIRYDLKRGGWTNRIGLRNPGIGWLADRAQRGRADVTGKLISVHGFNADEWALLIERAAALNPLGIELNMSCPNVGEVNWPGDLFRRAADCGAAVVVKLPPIHYEQMFADAWQAGLRCFHCCNTLPVEAGGLSGRPLKPHSLACIRELRDRLGEAERDELTIIGGGGVYRPADVDEYADAGAHCVAIGTKAMNPLCLLSHRSLRPLIDRAAQRFVRR